MATVTSEPRLPGAAGVTIGMVAHRREVVLMTVNLCDKCNAEPQVGTDLGRPLSNAKFVFIRCAVCSDIATMHVPPTHEREVTRALQEATRDAIQIWNLRHPAKASPLAGVRRPKLLAV
jgi:hypothetical protein